MDERSINDLIASLKNITMSCIEDVNSEEFAGLINHIEERANIIEKLRPEGNPSDYVRELLKEYDIFNLDEELRRLVNEKKQIIYNKMKDLANNNRASKQYKTTQLMTNVFFNTRR